MVTTVDLAVQCAPVCQHLLSIRIVCNRVTTKEIHLETGTEHCHSNTGRTCPRYIMISGILLKDIHFKILKIL